MTQSDNIREVVSLNPDYIGFIFYPQSPRDMSERICDFDLSIIPPTIERVAVLVNEPLINAKMIIRKWGFHAVQLHGEENPEYCRELMQECTVIRSFPVGESLPKSLPSFQGVCNYFLLDTATKQRGGSGKAFNHGLLEQYNLSVPYILSGGIGPDDAEHILNLKMKHERMVGIDLNSRFEVSPGVKDMDKLRIFFKNIERR